MTCLRKSCQNRARISACRYQGYCSERCADMDEGVKRCKRPGCPNEAKGGYCSRSCGALATNNIAKATTVPRKRPDNRTPADLERRMNEYFLKQMDPTYYDNPKIREHLLRLAGR